MIERLSGVLVGLALAATGCGAGVKQATATVGASGGALTLGNGVTVTLPAGALTRDTAVTVRELEVGGQRHLELEPRGLALAVRGQVEVRIRDGVELGTLHVREDGQRGELEAGRRHEDAARHALELEIEHLGELEVGDDRGTETEPLDDRGRGTTTATGADDHGGHGAP